MPKIKKFNLKLSVYSIQQQLKKAKYNVCEETISDIKIMADELREKLTPAVYFQNFTARNNLGIDFPQEAVAASVVVSGVGSGAEDFINAYSGSDKYEIAKAVLYQAVDETKKFAWRLIAGESSEEKSALSEKVTINEQEKLNQMKDILSKIDIYPSQNGLNPAYSFVEVAFWIPVKKKSKNRI